MSGALAGRRILIAGGAQGIGRATVARFLAEGARVAVIDRDGAALDGLQVPAAVADITDSAALAAAVTRLAGALGGLDGLVNCAGLDLVAALEQITDEAWDRLIAVNLTGAMKLCRAAVPHLRQAGAAPSSTCPRVRVWCLCGCAAAMPPPRRGCRCSRNRWRWSWRTAASA